MSTGGTCDLGENGCLAGKTVIITGANTGIGKETARKIAEKGAKVILACRNEEKAIEAREEIITGTGNDNVSVKKLDLASFSSIKSFADDINRDEGRLDILVCNAGVATIKRHLTEDGMELMFGVNHLGHFLLTNLLLEKLIESGARESHSRIVIVASEAHELAAQLDFEDLQHELNFQPFKVYARSKTCNILFGVYLTDMLKDTFVNVYTLHPGLVDTELSRDVPMTKCCYKCVVAFLSCKKFKTPQSGSDTTVFCCTSDKLAQETGKYYSDCKEKMAKRYATDKDKAKELWSRSLKYCGLVSNIYEPPVTSV